jgi:hypothetical protein
MSDGYVYRLRYYRYQIEGDTTYLVAAHDTEYYDIDLDTIRSYARGLNEDNTNNTHVTLTRRRIVPTPGWEEIEI